MLRPHLEAYGQDEIDAAELDRRKQVAREQATREHKQAALRPRRGVRRLPRRGQDARCHGRRVLQGRARYGQKRSKARAFGRIENKPHRSLCPHPLFAYLDSFLQVRLEKSLSRR